MLLRGALFFQKHVGALYSFVIDEEEPSMEISIPFPIKARDPSYGSWKRMDPMVDLKTTKQSALAITSNGREASSLRKSSLREGREKVLNHKSQSLIYARHIQWEKGNPCHS